MTRKSACRRYASSISTRISNASARVITFFFGIGHEPQFLYNHRTSVRAPNSILKLRLARIDPAILRLRRVLGDICHDGKQQLSRTPEERYRRTGYLSTPAKFDIGWSYLAHVLTSRHTVFLFNVRNCGGNIYMGKRTFAGAVSLCVNMRESMADEYRHLSRQPRSLSASFRYPLSLPPTYLPATSHTRVLSSAHTRTPMQ